MFPDKDAALPVSEGPKSFTNLFADIFAAIFVVYFFAIFSILVGVFGLAISVVGLTGFLNSTGTATGTSDRAVARLDQLARIRKWISRAAWTSILAGALFIGVQLLREKLGADLEFFDYFLSGSVFVLLGIAILFVSAIGGLIARLTIRRLG